MKCLAVLTLWHKMGVALCIIDPFRMRLLCLHNSANATRNASPSGALIPATIATRLLEEEEGDFDGDASAAAEVVPVAAAVTVTVAVFVLLGDVDPDVRLKITLPASTEKGALLPLVGMRQVLLNGLDWLQQNRNWLFKTPNGNMVAPLSGTTTFCNVSAKIKL